MTASPAWVRRLRIAFVICGDLDFVSGGFLYDRRLIAGLRAAGHTVDVISLPWRRYLLALTENLRPWPFDPRSYQIVVQDELCHPAVLGRNRRLRAAGLPVVALVHNLASVQPVTPARKLVHACERAYLRGLAGVLAVCTSTAEDAETCAGRALSVQVALPGRDHVDPVGAESLAARRNLPLRLLYTGVVAPHKGLHRLLPVLSGLDSAITLDVAGSVTSAAGYVAQLREQSARLGLQDRIRWHGQLDARALYELRTACHVFVMPSDREAYPLAALEALSAGLPVLLTNAGGTGELVGGSAAGKVLDPEDVAGWKAAIAHFASDRAAWLIAAKTALARHRAHPTWDDCAAEVAVWLQEVVATKVAPARRRSNVA